MKEISLENGKARLLKNKYDIDVRVGKKDDKYFIIHNSKARGPFEKIILEDDNENELTIMGYNHETSKIYCINEEGLSLIKKEKIDLENYKREKKGFNNCTFITNINNYSIFLDNKSNKLFVVNSDENLKNVDDYMKFNTFNELKNYYIEQKNIYLRDPRLTASLSKNMSLFIRFSDLYKDIINLNLSELPDDIIFDILADRSVFKKIFDVEKEKLIVYVPSNSSKEQELIDANYTKIKYIGYETLLKSNFSEIDTFNNLLQNRIKDLKNDAPLYLKESDEIDFYKLELLMSSLSIKDLPCKVCSEIGANRPLTKGIFLSMLCACFEKLEKEGYTIRYGYRNLTNFSICYPNQYSILWGIALDKLPSLYTEYFEERKKLAHKYH